MLSGSATFKVDDEMVELKRLDALRVPGPVARGMESGPEGAELWPSGRPTQTTRTPRCSRTSGPPRDPTRTLPAWLFASGAHRPPPRPGSVAARGWINRYDFAGVVERCERAIELFTREGVSRVLLLGDLAHDGDLASVRQIVRAARSSVPLLAVGGNHDSPDPTKRIAAAGRDRVRLPGWRALGPDAVRLAGLRPARRARRRWAAARRPALTTWSDSPVLLASHFPVLSHVRAITGHGLPYAGDLVDHADVAQALVARGAPTVVACGHLHVRYSVASGPLLQLGLGAARRAALRRDAARAGAQGPQPRGRARARELDEARERHDPRLAPAEEIGALRRGAAGGAGSWRLAGWLLGLRPTAAMRGGTGCRRRPARRYSAFVVELTVAGTGKSTMERGAGSPAAGWVAGLGPTAGYVGWDRFRRPPRAPRPPRDRRASSACSDAPRLGVSAK